MAASDFWKALDRLGLSQYHDRLVQEAFDSWEVLPDIMGEDLLVSNSYKRLLFLMILQ